MNLYHSHINHESLLLKRRLEVRIMDASTVCNV